MRRPLVRNRPGWSETDNPGGYGNVTLYPGVLSYWGLVKHKFRKPRPVTMHVGWEDADVEFHEEASWQV